MSKKLKSQGEKNQKKYFLDCVFKALALVARCCPPCLFSVFLLYVQVFLCDHPCALFQSLLHFFFSHHFLFILHLSAFPFIKLSFPFFPAPALTFQPQPLPLHRIPLPYTPTLHLYNFNHLTIHHK